MATKRNAKPVDDRSNDVSTERKRNYLSQSDVPAFSLSRALRVAQAISDNYGKAPTRPLRVAEAMDMLPSSSTFRMLTGASIAYGLTDGGYNAELISLTLLARRVLTPTSEGDDMLAMREATLRPRVVREFLTKYNNSRIPAAHIARNVLAEMGVPVDRAEGTLELILDGARAVGFLREVKGQTYVDLDSTPTIAVGAVEQAPDEHVEGDGDDLADPVNFVPREPFAPVSPISNRRVFITHGKNRDIVNQLKELLTFGSFDPVVSVERETVSKPVPDKVLDDMRSCAAAIIHVGTELRLLDRDGSEHNILNPNVLIEIGAAMALYGRKFILLVEKGVTLPSNLQGLYEVRYEGDRLEYDSTMKLLKAFNDFRS